MGRIEFTIQPCGYNCISLTDTCPICENFSHLANSHLKNFSVECFSTSERLVYLLCIKLEQNRCQHLLCAKMILLSFWQHSTDSSGLPELRNNRYHFNCWTMSTHFQAFTEVRIAKKTANLLQRNQLQPIVSLSDRRIKSSRQLKSRPRTEDPAYQNNHPTPRPIGSRRGTGGGSRRNPFIIGGAFSEYNHKIKKNT